ncbi:6-hydroxy-3-succinoylpyridine 3-monooxygenase HspA [bacterium HR26]|nr:6-hydroxy-3-succinoylpyridine 3-monooxygenase HspA [bacterium HR26]
MVLNYGALKGTPYRWLDIATLCTLLLPNHAIHRIRYFTARIQPLPNDPSKAQRQQAYLRALQTIPHLTIHYGRYLARRARMPLVNPPATGPRIVEVWRVEEKGSDVNLAIYLLLDGFQRDYEQAVVISNDSDLVEPIRVVRKHLGLSVGVFNPHPNTSHALRQVTSFYRPFREGVLRASQFPPVLQDAHGIITKPRGW